jgi:hypothetical protein
VQWAEDSIHRSTARDDIIWSDGESLLLLMLFSYDVFQMDVHELWNIQSTFTIDGHIDVKNLTSSHHMNLKYIFL